MTKNGPAKKNAKTTITLHENEAALIFGPDGPHLLLPDAAMIPEYMLLPIALMRKMGDAAWMRKLSAFADEMQRADLEAASGQKPAEGRPGALMEGVSHAMH